MQEFFFVRNINCFCHLFSKEASCLSSYSRGTGLILKGTGRIGDPTLQGSGKKRGKIRSSEQRLVHTERQVFSLTNCKATHLILRICVAVKVNRWHILVIENLKTFTVFRSVICLSWVRIRLRREHFIKGKVLFFDFRSSWVMESAVFKSAVSHCKKFQADNTSYPKF